MENEILFENVSFHMMERGVSQSECGSVDRHGAGGRKRQESQRLSSCFWDFMSRNRKHSCRWKVRKDRTPKERKRLLRRHRIFTVIRYR
ncbi:hypothetical protein [Gallintestinimicrobium sp.]|uniref:hypothetical protein n=1 Tax=Gallintestinimicrobium sp. TaxID=2981655 RepID=UPI003994EEA2